MNWKRNSRRRAGRGSSAPDAPVTRTAAATPSGRPVALVTGAGRAIGRDVALAFARNGFDVVLAARTDRVSVAAVAETAARIRAAGVGALTVPMDLREGATVLAAADRVLETWGRVDVLVNNAQTRPGDAKETAALTRGLYRHQLALIQRLLPSMVDRGSGVVINLLSGPDRGDRRDLDAASQDAFRRLTDVVNSQYRDSGVRGFNLGPDTLLADPGQGVDTLPAELVAASAVWLATDTAADRYLDKVVWVPKHVRTLAA